MFDLQTIIGRNSEHALERRVLHIEHPENPTKTLCGEGTFPVLFADHAMEATCVCCLLQAAIETLRNLQHEHETMRKEVGRKREW